MVQLSEIPRKYWIIGGVILFLVISLLAVLLVFGTDGGNNRKPPAKQIELTWWKIFEENENVSELISKYQSAHPNVRINFVKKNINDYEEELIDAIASGTGPDIFSIHNDWLPKHMDKIVPMPVTMMSERTYQETFVDVATEDFVKDGRIFAIPMAVDVLALFYNKDILNSAGIAQPPATWSEMVNAVQKITRVSQPGTFSRSGIAMGTSANVNRGVDALLLLMLQNGTKFYSADFTSATFDQSLFNGSESFQPGKTALEYYTQFATPSKTTYTWNSKTDQSVDAFTQGKVGMMLSYSYMMPVITDRSPNLNWGVAAAPQIDQNSTRVNFANYWGETVSKASPNAEAAWDFLNFVSKKENLAAYYNKHKLVSSRKDLIPDQISDPQIGVFAENALTARSVYKKDAAKFEGIIAKMIDDVVLRNIKPEEAIQTAVLQLNLSMQR